MATVGEQLHFQCSFEIRASPLLPDPWSTLVKSCRHWVEQAPRHQPPITNPAFYGSWFFTGGEWRSPGTSSFNFVKTLRFVGSGSEQEPQHWAMRYEHKDEKPGRTWRNDIGVTRLRDGVFQFSVVLSHSLMSGFIGREPEMPVPTAPRIVGWLLNSEDWECYAGSELLESVPKVLKVGGGESFREQLRDPARLCPIVLVSRDFSTSLPLLDAGRLARLLQGSASVYESETSELDKELEWCLGRKFSCWNGMVRVYQPGLRFDHSASPKRQRYFSGNEIQLQGADVVTEMLVRGVARRSATRSSNVVASVDDLTSIEREYRMLTLKAATEDKGREEWVRLLETTNAELEASNESKAKDISCLMEAVADSEEQVSRLEYEKKFFMQRATDADREAKSLAEKAAILQGLERLPKTMIDVVELVQRAFAGRVAFTERAIKSAKACEYRDIDNAWNCLRHMATTLHSLLFGERASNDLEKEFLERSGFQLAMTEGKMTKDDNRLMQSRSDTFQGDQIDCTPHVKFDKDSTRAYFCPFQKEKAKLIVISYIGHLDTAGTRRRRD